jgi:hypothetical protein
MKKQIGLSALLAMALVLAPGTSQARWMNPRTGRFHTMDSYAGDPQQPLSLHKYLYCQGDPVNGTDPTGHDFLLGGFFQAINGFGGIASSLNAVAAQLERLAAQVERMALSDRQIANIIFNETRSLSGNTIEQARQNVAHAIINGDRLEVSGRVRRPRSASTTARVPEAENRIYEDCRTAVTSVRGDTVDPTRGAIHFNLRPNDSQAPFQEHEIRTHNGPYNNSYPRRELPATGIYVNTYE